MKKLHVRTMSGFDGIYGLQLLYGPSRAAGMTAIPS